jgi:hypothetical protein
VKEKSAAGISCLKDIWNLDPTSAATSEGVRRKLEAIEKRKVTRPAFEGMWLSLQDSFCRFQAALWFAPVAMC